MNNVIFVSYAAGKYKENIKWNSFFVKHFIRPKYYSFYTDEDLKKDSIYELNRLVFDSKVGAGYWAWKPWCILKEMKKAKEGDIIIYQDCGKGLRYKNFLKPQALIEYTLKNGVFPGVLVPEHGNNKEWTHESCFINMECLGGEYYYTPQVEAVISAWVVNSDNKKILADWLRYCLDVRVVSDNYICEHSSFATKGHRYDQSILTNLVVKNNLSPLNHNIEGLHLFKSLSFLNLFISQNTFFGRMKFKILYLAVKIIRFTRHLIMRIKKLFSIISVNYKNQVGPWF